MSTTRCIYCNKYKTEEDFSLEHIWPDALGGDYLPEFWQTRLVCSRCNNLSGRYVDGAFIKSFFVNSDRWLGSELYLDPTDGFKAISPIIYLGYVEEGPIPSGYSLEYYAGPCGANIFHFRPIDEDLQWDTYVGGDPIKFNKKATAGTVFLWLTSQNEYWIKSSLASLKKRFRRANRFIVNADIDCEDWAKPTVRYPEEIEDFREFIEWKQKLNLTGKNAFKVQFTSNPVFDHRFLCKLALAIGFKLFGNNFSGSNSETNLRNGFWEQDQQIRNQLTLNGISYFSPKKQSKIFDNFKWPGGWVLYLANIAEKMSLTLISPSGNDMSVLITDEEHLLNDLEEDPEDGHIWITVPTAKMATERLSLNEYLNHLLKHRSHKDLTNLESKINQPSNYPAC